MLRLYNNHIILLDILEDEVPFNNKFEYLEEVENLLKGQSVYMKKFNLTGHIVLVRSNGRGLVFLCQFTNSRWCDIHEIELC